MFETIVPKTTDRLPETAVGRLLDLEYQIKDFRTSQRGWTDARNLLRENLSRAKGDFARLKDADGKARPAPRYVEERSRGTDGRESVKRTVLPRDTWLLDEGKKRVKALEADLNRAEARLAKASDDMAGSMGLYEAIREYLNKACENQELKPDTEEVRVPLKPGLDPSDSVEKYRTQREALKLELDKVRNASVPGADAKKTVRAQIECLAEVGRPDVFGLIEGSRTAENIVWPKMEIGVGVVTSNGETGYTTGSVRDLAGVMAWLHKDALIAAIEHEIDEVADDKNALSTADRVAREEKILGDVLAIERSEVAIIQQAMERGTVIIPRRDTDPRAFLGLADTMPQPGGQ